MEKSEEKVQPDQFDLFHYIAFTDPDIPEKNSLRT